MNEKQMRRNAADFAKEWEGRGYEKGQTQVFWLSLLTRVLGVEDADRRIVFEDRVKVGGTKFIDARIPESLVLIEQKGVNVRLDDKCHLDDGRMLTPMEQAQNYVRGLPRSQHPRYIVVCNFATFQIYDCETLQTEYIQLKDLEKECHRLAFLVDPGKDLPQREMQLSLQAGELVGLLYDALLRQYIDPDSPQTKHSLNALCVRLVFCLYAEDADIFGKPNMFLDYMKAHRRDARRALIDLFRTLDTKPEDRDPYMEPDLAAFPYVNGGLFAEDGTVIPRLTDEILELLLRRASADFDWSGISPTIFGAVFESTLNPETRRSGGMHYTSVANIHKVIDPLFLDALRAELADIRAIAVERTRMAKLREFQNKLASLTFLDPACGSGNFLTETYLSLRRLENEVISLLNKGQSVFALSDSNPVKIGISQFYGIEINDFAVTVARTALWIAESQMLRETEAIVRNDIDFLPLKAYANIVEGNALTLPWADVVPPDKLSYIMGNPPFVGARYMGEEQKADILRVFHDAKNAGNLDFVTGWYRRAAEYMQGTRVECGFVSSNSICQGEQVALLWRDLMERFHVRINFAHQSFVWNSEARGMAHVHCVIVGFATFDHPEKFLFQYDSPKSSEPRRVSVSRINGYLLDAPDVYIDSRSHPLGDVPEIGIGNKPIDGGFYLFKPEEKDAFLEKEPGAAPYFHPWMGSEELIKGKSRFCLYLRGVPPSVLKGLPLCRERIESVRKFRLESKSPGTRKLADTPTRFHVTNIPDEPYMVIPEVSSERRDYIPCGYVGPDVISSNLVKIVPHATLYHFGVIISAMHMAWMRQVGGRLESRYRYSKDIVYNNFPWPDADEATQASIAALAQGVLDARELYPGETLAGLYDPLLMPDELRAAHRALDAAVDKAYGRRFANDTERVTHLFNLYRSLAQPLDLKEKPQSRRAKKPTEPRN